MSDVYSKVTLLRDSFNEGVLRSIDYRKEIIEKFVDLLSENEKGLVDALFQDLHRCEGESLAYEVLVAKHEARIMVKNLDTWLADEYISRSIFSAMDTGYTHKEPYGVVLIIAPWNFPILLSLQPLIGALAAGNCVLLKVSEYAPHCSSLLSELIPKYIDKRVCQVVCGEAEVCQRLLEKEQFDHIFFTGGTNVGREVYVAAAKKLTPVILELGGKCPAYIDSKVDLDMAAHRIAWSKILNSGQLCITTDYVLCHETMIPDFHKAVENALKEFLGEDPHSSPDYARIINAKHFDRITKLLDNTEGKIILGGKTVAEDLYVAPTVVTNVQETDILMQEELFAPILPILSVKSYKDAVRIINHRSKPLAIYVFTNDSEVFKHFLDETSSGAILQNGCVYHAVVSELPFGGVGYSGMGAYHGRHSIDAFSHKRAVLLRTRTEYVNQKVLYYPYSESKVGWMRWIFGDSRSKCCIL